MFIKFNNDDKLYDLTYEDKDRLVTLINSTDTVPINTSGFNIIDDDGETVLSSYSDYTLIYKQNEDSIVYTNELHNYYIIFLYNSTSTYVNGFYIKRNDEINSEKEVLYKEIHEAEYTPESIQIKYIDSDGFPMYKVVDNELQNTTEEEKAIWLSNKQAKQLTLAMESKLKEINDNCQSAIVAGVDYNGEHFSYELEDQNNIDNLLNLAKSSNGMDVPYHADNGNCKLYSANDIFAIYIAQKTNVAHHTTYANQLKQYVKTLSTIKDIQAVYYGQELTGQYLETYNAMMEQVKAITEVATSVSTSEV